MSAIFFVIVLLSSLVLLFTSPEGVFSSLLSGGQKALDLTLTMTAVYAVWLGILKIAEDCGLTEKLAKALKKPIRFLFGNISSKAEEFVAMNLSANLLGMGGVATPMGISAAQELDKTDNIFAMGMLFVLSATSIQLLPTSVITLRAEAGSTAPSDIIFPTLIVTVISTMLACVVFTLLCKKGKRK